MSTGPNQTTILAVGDIDAFKREIVADVLDGLRSLLAETSAKPAAKKLTRIELAERMDVDVSTIDRWAKAKRIPSLMSGGTRRFDIDAVESALATNAAS